MLVTRGLGGVWPSAVVAGLGAYSSAPTPPAPTPSGGGGRHGHRMPSYPKGRWRVDYLEDYLDAIPEVPVLAPAVKKPRRRKTEQLSGPLVTPLDLLTSFGVELKRIEAEPLPVARPMVPVVVSPRRPRVDINLLIQQYRQRAEAVERAERLKRLKQQNAAAFILLL